MSKNSRRRAMIEEIARQNERKVKVTDFIQHIHQATPVALQIGAAVLFIFMFYQCSKDNSREEVAQCLVKVKNLSNKYSSSKDYINARTESVGKLKAEIYFELQKDISAMSQYVDKDIKAKGEHVAYLRNCNLQYYEETRVQDIKYLDERLKQEHYDSLPEEMKLTPQELRAKVENDMAKAYAEIDQAEVKEFEAARKKAVQHYRTIPGPGVQVETFVFKDGRTVICSTKVGSTGRLTSCDGSLD